jgi:hypothetical protein
MRVSFGVEVLTLTRASRKKTASDAGVAPWTLNWVPAGIVVVAAAALGAVGTESATRASVVATTVAIRRVTA